MLELWQTEWCPASRRVRQRLTELGIDYVTRQVPVEKDERTLLRERTGIRHDPGPRRAEAARSSSARRRFAATSTADRTSRAEAKAHRLKAEKARRRYLEEECECPQPATH